MDLNNILPMLLNQAKAHPVIALAIIGIVYVYYNRSKLLPQLSELKDTLLPSKDDLTVDTALDYLREEAVKRKGNQRTVLLNLLDDAEDKFDEIPG